MGDEADTIRQSLLSEMRGRWDGRECIEYLRRHEYNWRQMEWIGWYFEHRAQRVLEANIGGCDGPRYGNVVFDYSWHGIWDFKAHPDNQQAGWTYLNDVEAVRKCVRDNGHLGWVLGCGPAEYDDTGSFKIWHDELKGRRSAYELDRIRRGAKSRRRKFAFKLERVEMVEFRSCEQLEAAVAEGWLSDTMQMGQRNAGGSSRRPKYGLNLERWRASGLAN